MLKGAMYLRKGTKDRKIELFIQDYASIVNTILSFVCTDNEFLIDVNSRFQLKLGILQNNQIRNTGDKFSARKLLKLFF